MKTYAERLAYAMRRAGLEPHSDQSTLARMVGYGCKPQNIQHLLDPNKNAKSSKYTPRIAEVLDCDVNWLSYGGPNKPSMPKEGSAPSSAEATTDSSAVDPEQGAFEDINHRRLPPGRRIAVVGQAQGGPDGYISIHDFPPEHSDGWIVLPSQDPDAYALRVRGDSMRPRIKSGEFILVEPSFEALPGDDVVVKFNDGNAVAKELLWIRDDEIALGSINNGVPPMTRPLSSVLTIHRIAAIIPRGSPFHQTDE